MRLLVGYGNTLRCDDGAGYCVAEVVEEWGIPNLRVQSLHQLTPELVDELAAVDQVVFVDSSIKCDERQVTRIEAGSQISSLVHYCDPRSLLSLCQSLHGRCPEAWLVSIPAVNLQHGSGFSSVTERELHRALEWIRQWCTDNSCTKSAC